MKIGKKGILDTTRSKLKCEKMYSTWEYYNSCLIDTFLVSVFVIVWLVGWLVSLLVVDWLVLFVLVAVLWLLVKTMTDITGNVHNEYKMHVL